MEEKVPGVAKPFGREVRGREFHFLPCVSR